MTLIIQPPSGGKLTLTNYYIPVDPDFGSVSLLLHGDGANGSTTITDSSPSPKAVTVFGNAQISTAQSKFGGASITFDGNGDYLELPAAPDFAFGTGNFTVETWVYISSYHPTQGYALIDTIPVGGFGNRANAFVWVITTSGKLDVFSDSSFRGLSTSIVPLSQWVHLALVRNGTTWQYYINGVKDGTEYTYSQDLSLAQGALIGRLGDSAAYFFNGYIDDVRITKGVARYTSNFTPPTAPFPDIESR